VTSPSRGWTPWTRWSLARQLPLLTAALLVLVLGLSLTLTYGALRQARAEALHTRLQGLLRPLIRTSEQGVKARVALMHVATSDSAVQRALLAPAAAPGLGAPPVAADSAVMEALAKIPQPVDSGFPVELWTTDGRRLAHVGREVRDSVSQLRPEMRSLRGTRVSEIPTGSEGSDSVQMGAFYPSGGRMYLWIVAPVMRAGTRIGYVAQQRRIASNPVIVSMVRDLSGEEVSVYYRNATDNAWTSIDGRPVPPPVTRDTMEGGLLLRHGGGELQVAMEGHVPGTPYIYVAEIPASSISTAPWATLRRIASLSALLLIGGVFAAWVLSRRITRPLVELTTAAEAIALGNYGRRVETRGATGDEVLRLGASFNRMASEVQASQDQLASQVEEAQATSEELEQTNVQLQEASTAADEARDAALNANRAKSDFLAVMSHELRTPLNAIGGYTEILQIGIYGQLNDAQKDALLRIARSQQTLLSLINDVLNFAKLEAGEVRYQIDDVHLTPALASLEELIAPQLSDRNLRYTVAPCDATLTVRADSEKLQQILINLLSNAIKYTPKGGAIDVRCDVDPSSVRLHVHDTGIGIADDRMQKIFDPFIQVGRALNRPHEGVGLGLSISRDLASAMGGSLSVSSVLGEGSTFTLTLKRAAAPN
jgi:signal transduction histidine kinase